MTGSWQLLFSWELYKFAEIFKNSCLNQILGRNMDCLAKEQYASPRCEELEVTIERALATSAPEYEDGGPLN